VCNDKLNVIPYNARLLDTKHSNITRRLLSSCQGDIMEADYQREHKGNRELIAYNDDMLL